MARKFWGAACSTIALVLASPAFGQVGASETEAPEAADSGEILVTAQRRSQNVQTVGISISAISSDEIVEQRIQQPTDLARAVPGLQTAYATSDAVPIFAIRGIGLDDFNPNNSSGVGVYVNDVFQANPAFLVVPFYDVASVEVLKGPQGTLYGRNTTGGAINVTTKGPSDTWDGYASLGFGRFNTFDTEGAVGGPLGEGLSFRLSGILTHQGHGFQTDIDTGERYGQTKRGAVRGQLKIDLSPTADLLFDLHYAADRSIPQSPQSVNFEQAADAIGSLDPTVLDFFGTPVEGLINAGGDPRRVRVGAIRPFIHSDSYGASAKLNVDLDFATLLSITSFDKNKTTGLDNYDGVPVSELDLYNNYKATQWNQELRLVSNPSSSIKWVVGAAIGEDNLDYNTFGDLTFTVLAQDLLNLVTVDGSYIQKTQSLGAYGNVEVPLTERLSVIGGLRYSRDKRSFDGTTTNPSLIFAPTGIIATLDEEHVNNRLLYRAGINFQATDDILLYGSYSSGYKAGAFYGAPASTQATWGYIPPESVKALELGFKSRFLDRRVTLNAAYFNTDYKDRQSSVTALGGAGVYVTLASIPKSRIQGFEWDLSVRPVDGLEFGFSGTHVDAKVREGVASARGAALAKPIVPGESLSQAPKWSYALSGRYETRVGSGLTIAAGANWSWSGETVSFLGDTQADYGPLRNLSANIELASDAGWKVQIWGNNLTNSSNRTYSFTNFLGERTFYLEKPKTYGVTVRYDF